MTVMFKRALVALIAIMMAGLGAVAAGSSAAAGPNWWEPVNRPTPDSQINVTGEPMSGLTATGEIRGILEAHNHVFSNEGFGGRMICGKVFDTAGIAEALKDCPEHYPNGAGALFENLTGGADGTHDPVGYPTFAHWPKYNSLSHQQNYYAWMERAWRGGVRVMVNDLVTNGLICSILPRDRGCNEMASIRLQAQKTYELQTYVDNMYGGPGKGWFRVVKTPEELRSVVAAGKLAVVLGVEMSEPFGCKQILNVAQCSKADIDAGLDELYGLGVRSMFLCHKFDNALCGVRFDSDTIGLAVNVGQFLSTGTFWETEPCTAPERDNPISSGSAPAAWANLLPAGTSTPDYDPNQRCNRRGLTKLGEHAVRGLMSRGMMLEVDHMSVKAADRALDILESAGYPGVVSSHSWMEPRWHERVYRLGGFLTQYGHGSEQFVEEWHEESALRATYDQAYGFGTDMNGVGGTAPPRASAATNPVTYPFTSADGGSVLTRQTTGQRTWDINTDGVAHYGMVPDWIEDMRKVGGNAVVSDLLKGAQMYLDTWAAADTWSQPANLAAGAAVSASSTEWTLFNTIRPSYATDTKLDTRWASKWSDSQWLRVDLGTARQVGRVSMVWEAAYAKAYDVQVSGDGSTWQTVASVGNGNGNMDTVSFTPRTARYVRLVLKQRATSYGYSLYEVGVAAH